MLQVMPYSRIDGEVCAYEAVKREQDTPKARFIFSMSLNGINRRQTGMNPGERACYLQNLDCGLGHLILPDLRIILVNC